MRSNDSSTLPTFKGSDFKLKFLIIDIPQEDGLIKYNNIPSQRGSINIFIKGAYNEIDFAHRKKYYFYEFEDAMKKNENFKLKKFREWDYKFVLIEKDRKDIVFEEFNEEFWISFLESLKNILIIGNNYDISKFKQSEIFNEWYDKYTNIYHPLKPGFKSYIKKYKQDVKEGNKNRPRYF